MPDVNEISSTTQKFLDIFDITNDVVVLKDGTISLIMVISAMNFGLLAEQEQDAVIYAYAALLNSLNFPVQIIISSKTKDATAYLRLLDEQAEKASTQEKEDLIKRYQTFVGQLIRERNVLDKKFYVAVPASPAEVGMITPSSVLPGNSETKLTREQKTAVIEKGLGVLEPRRDHLIAQFNRIGLYARQLHTQEIIEIFYNNYNPEAYEGQQITDSSNYTTMVVQAKTAPDLSSLKSLTEANTANQDNPTTLADVPPAGVAEISESAVVPRELPENNAVGSSPPQLTNQQLTEPLAETKIEQPVTQPTLAQTAVNPLPKPTQQTVFQAKEPALDLAPQQPPMNQPVAQPAGQNQPQLTLEKPVNEVPVNNPQPTDKPLPPVAEL
jgi:hypothetical protein